MESVPATSAAAEPRAIVGRELEIGVLLELLAAARTAPAAVVLDGEAGIGKTTLHEVALAAARADGFAVCSCRPAEAEAAFSFAALGDLLRPVLPAGLARLPPPQRRALAAALLLEEVAGTAPEPRAIAFAVSQLLQEHGDGPLLVAVDDVQWLDEASASVLAFALRRLAAAPVAILVARRGSGTEAAPLGLERALSGQWLRRVRLGSLSVGATHRLLRRRLRVSFPRPTLVELHRTAGGNPFYALELGRALEKSGRHAEAGERLAVPTSLSGLVSARLAGLPEEVREALEPLALLGEPTVATVAAVAGDPATAARRLHAAELAGIVELSDERVRFSHPLLAAAVEAALGRARRRALHRRLAELVDDPEQRARHLALGASGPSAGVAEALETASTIAAHRGASAAAAELAELAVSLTPPADDAARRRRQLLAAGYHYASGDAERSRLILEPLVEQLPPGVERARVLRQLGEISNDDLERSERLLDQASLEAEPDPRLRAEIVPVRVTIAFLRHGPAAAAELARRSSHVVEESGDLVLIEGFLAQRALAELCAAGIAPGVLERALALEELVGPPPTDTPPTLVEGMRLMYADDHDAAREALQRVHALGVERDDAPTVTQVLLFLTELECRAGAWSRADAYAAELLESAEQQGLEHQGGVALWCRGIVDAYLGRLDEARARAAEGVSRSREEGDQAFLERNLALLGLIDLSTGDYRAAAERLAGVVRRRHARGAWEPSLYPARELAIEALVADGELDEARVQLGWLEDAGRRLQTPWPLAMGARCRALLQAADGDLAAALASCEQALAVHDRMPAPFERARTLLIYGAMLRRAKQRRAAGAAIGEALAFFEGLPAPVWAANARRELARIGGRRASGDELTEGERRIAELVAAGRSNKETAAALYLSAQTVEGALKRVYRKLGVRSRTELSRRLSTEPAGKDA
jgi:DNA-binding CsgD family transcriptional regulator